MKKILCVACIVFGLQFVLTGVAADAVIEVSSIQADRMARMELIINN